MNKEKALLGIDLGTSSVKLVKRCPEGKVEKATSGYVSKDPKGWWQAIAECFRQLDLTDVEAIGLSSQVGTYIVDEREVISWDSPIGAEETTYVKKHFSKETFLEEISMPHPDVISYPMPRLLYLRRKYPEAKRICQPKDYICQKLTGNWVTDPYSWRGLANLEKGTYSRKFLSWLGIEESQLPEMKRHTDLAGVTRESIEDGLPGGIPVYIGLNDYYASLLGMGIGKPGDLFDITGTSEHLGVIEEQTSLATSMVSGPYLKNHVHYGVTASSGASLDFALGLKEDGKVSLDEMVTKNPPIFLPYLKGERAPIWDSEACGMFFGIQAGCTKEELAYGVLEGVAFSLYHIYEHMGRPEATQLCIAGGASVNPVLNRLKTELFQIPSYTLQEKDTSALGAVMVAGIGVGRFSEEQDAIEECCHVKDRLEPTGTMQEFSQKRYEIYKELYPATRQQMKAIRRI